MVVLAGSCIALLTQKTDKQALHNSIRSRELAYAKVSTQWLGAHLAERYPNKRTMVIMPFAYMADMERRDAQIEGLLEGIAGRLDIVQELNPLPPEFLRTEKALKQLEEDPESLPSIDSWFNAKYFNEIVKEHGNGCELVISLVGMPEDFEKVKLYPKVPVRLAVYQGPTSVMGPALASGAIVANVTQHPKPRYDAQSPPVNLEVAFKKRFMLATTENVQEIAELYPWVFSDLEGLREEKPTPDPKPKKDP